MLELFQRLDKVCLKTVAKRFVRYNYNHGQNMRETLVFMWNSAIQENFNFYFSAIFC